jgi:hypothetical protein
VGLVEDVVLGRNSSRELKIVDAKANCHTHGQIPTKTACDSKLG